MRGSSGSPACLLVLLSLPGAGLAEGHGPQPRQRRSPGRGPRRRAASRHILGGSVTAGGRGLTAGPEPHPPPPRWVCRSLVAPLLGRRPEPVRPPLPPSGRRPAGPVRRLPFGSLRSAVTSTWARWMLSCRPHAGHDVVSTRQRSGVVGHDDGGVGVPSAASRFEGAVLSSNERHVHGPETVRGDGDRPQIVEFRLRAGPAWDDGSGLDRLHRLRDRRRQPCLHGCVPRPATGTVRTATAALSGSVTADHQVPVVLADSLGHQQPTPQRVHRAAPQGERLTDPDAPCRTARRTSAGCGLLAFVTQCGEPGGVRIVGSGSGIRAAIGSAIRTGFPARCSSPTAASITMLSTRYACRTSRVRPASQARTVDGFTPRSRRSPEDPYRRPAAADGTGLQEPDQIGCRLSPKASLARLPLAPLRLRPATLRRLWAASSLLGRFVCAFSLLVRRGSSEVVALLTGRNLGNL